VAKSDLSTLPANPLIQSTPADTLRRCAWALSALESIRPDEIAAVASGDDHEGIGLQILLRTIGDAVRYEAARAEAGARAAAVATAEA
jgi:hypothetical protein